VTRHIWRIALVVALLALGAAVYSNVSMDGDSQGRSDEQDQAARCDGEPAVLSMRVVREIPHDPTAFTQGLAFRGSELFEGTGREGRSQIRQMDPETGEVLDSEPLSDEVFGEGVSASGDDLVQLTWKSGLAFVWSHDGNGFSEVGSHEYEGEGWGLATDEAGDLLMSDGSDEIQYRDPESFELVDTILVDRSGGEVGQLNELEYGEGRLWANQWKSDEILRIRTDCGDTAVVDGVLDASQLTERARAAAVAGNTGGIDVLNGIAHLDQNRYLLTGKLWPLMFEVELVEPAG
jgi:glutamine cyclotransferase